MRPLKFIFMPDRVHATVCNAEDWNLSERDAHEMTIAIGDFIYSMMRRPKAKRRKR